MGKKAKARRVSNAPVRVVAAKPPERPAPNWPLLALSAIGVVLAGYLTWTSWAGVSVRGCGVGSACDVVLTSSWARLFGVPTAFWGLLTYLALAATSFIRRVDWHWFVAWPVALFGTLYSAYLTIISLTVLDAACPYCLTSLTLMTATLALLTYQRPTILTNFSWTRWLSKTVPVAAAIILVVHLQYAGVFGEAPQGEDPMARGLAEHLTKIGAKFYGASWCPHCQDQKKLFGTSANRLPYIECSPSGRTGPPAAACSENNINSFPTWIIQGNRIEDVLTLNRLAEAAGYEHNQ